MMTERKTVPFGKPSGNERENTERVFNTDPETLRAENSRLQKALTQALEERNRLLKSRGLPTGSGKGSGLRVLEERLESARRELDRFKQDQKVKEEKIHILQERLTSIGRIPGIFIARLEEAIVSTGAHSDIAGTPVENAADAPDRVAERFETAVDSLWQMVKDNQALHDNKMNRKLEKLKESQKFTKNESDKLRDERDRRSEEMEDLLGQLRRSETEVTLRDEKLADLEKRLQEQEEANKKQSGTILKLKKQLNELRGSVDAELYSHITGSGGRPGETDSSWRDFSPTTTALISLVLGVALATGAWWLYQKAQPTLVGTTEELMLPPPEPPTPPPAILTEKITPATPAELVPGETHRDALQSGGKAPLLVKVPGGTFTMGTDRYAAPAIEKPPHTEQVKDFYISRYEVSFSEFEAFARTHNLELPKDQGWGRGNRPVINVSWYSAYAYAEWLSRQTGHRYRLPTEAEWEYAMGGGSEAFYWWGNTFEQGQEICFNCGTEWDGRSTAPVGQARPNQFGLFDMGGNVMEWVGDCLTNTATSPGCITRVVRGGSFNRPNDTLRITARRGLEAKSRHSTVGFRVVREVEK